MLPNASYFAFTATPKNKTLEIFGEPVVEGGETKHRPFHTYTMKQAIEERFIVDVLSTYTTVASYYRLITTVDDDPLFDTRRASRKLRAFVEGEDHRRPFPRRDPGPAEDRRRGSGDGRHREGRTDAGVLPRDQGLPT
jgi:hypothetical protein